MPRALITSSASAWWEAPNRPPAVQIQHHGQKIPATLCPDVGDIAAPNPIRVLNSNSRLGRFDVRTLNRGLVVSVRARLLADQAQLTHKPMHTKTANRHAVITPSSRSIPKMLRLSAESIWLNNSLIRLRSATRRNFDTATSKPVGVIARPRHIES